MNQNFEGQLVAERGFLDVDVQPDIDLKEEINRLRREKNAVILAHYYQVPEIQEIADFVGDSLDLSQKAAKTEADIIVFAGVKFMGETAKILSPQKKVLLPDLNAGCSLADSCPPDLFKKFLDEHPGHTVVTYINCTAEIKALSDVIVTSSNALKIINTIPKDQPIICAPDINLGRYLEKETGRDMVLWNGACEVHVEFSMEKIDFLKKKYPGAKLIAHPECPSQILEVADFVGSTSKLLNYSKDDSSKEFIVVTEEGIIHQMRKASPDKKFIPAPVNRYTQCACGECPYMKLNSLKKIYLCLKYEKPEIFVDEKMRERAYMPIKKMLDLSAS